MSIPTTLRLIQTEINRYDARYLEARAKRPELGAYATPRDVVTALRSGSTSGKFAIVAAVVEENREGPHHVWTSILLLGFAPLLVSLRADIGDKGNEDHDQRVILAFLDAVTSVSPSAGLYATAALRRLTAKALFPRKSSAGDAARSADVELAPFDEEEHSPWDRNALTEAELRIDAAWAAKRAARTEADLSAARPRVGQLPRCSRAAA